LSAVYFSLDLIPLDAPDQRAEEFLMTLGFINLH